MRTSLASSLWFPGILTALLLVLLLEAAALTMRIQAAGQAQQALRRTEQSLAQVRASTPSLALRAAVEAERERAAAELAAIRMSLEAEARMANPSELSAPRSSAEAFFDLLEFKERMRNAARRAGVALKGGERFGFAEYARAGPEPELTAAVLRQRILVERLLEALWSSHPVELLAVRREIPRTRPAPVMEGFRTGEEGRVVDSFTLDPRVSGRAAGLLESMAFRLEFAGSTATLRDLLNALAASDVPLLVRLVEVEPASGSPVNLQASAPGGALRRIGPMPMKFSVTVEFVQPGAKEDET